MQSIISLCETGGPGKKGALLSHIDMATLRQMLGVKTHTRGVAVAAEGDCYNMAASRNPLLLLV